MVKQNMKHIIIILIIGLIFVFVFTFFSINGKLTKSIVAVQTESKPFKNNNISSKEMILPYKQLPLSIIENSRPIVYLTFDDGPNKHTKKILSILKAEQINATFFILQPNIKTYRKELQQIVDDGHAIGCHGVSHTIKAFYETTTSPLEEMNTCRDSIFEFVQVETNLVRTPYGSVPHLSLKQKNVLENNGYQLWDWNVDSNDWQIHSTKQVINHTMQQINTLLAANESPVILFHDSEVTANALQQIIAKLKALNVEFKVLSDNYVPVQFYVEK